MWRWKRNQVDKLKDQIFLFAQQVNDRDEHIRLLTESATAMALNIQRLESEIAAINQRAADAAKRARLPTAAIIAQEAHRSENTKLVDSIVREAREHLKEALRHISPGQPSYGSRWQPQIDAIRRDIPELHDSLSCLHYAQDNITFDG